MARTWLTIRVELLSGIYAECDAAPGRVFLVGPRHTFEQLARAINVGFARWDFSHLYDFELADGNIVGFPDEDFGEEDVLDHAATKVFDRIKPDQRFGYRFDFGDEWIHECTVQTEKVDPVEAYGAVRVDPVPIFGWVFVAFGHRHPRAGVPQRLRASASPAARPLSGAELMWLHRLCGSAGLNPGLNLSTTHRTKRNSRVRIPRGCRV